MTSKTTSGDNIYTRIDNFSFVFPSDWSEQPNYSLKSGDGLYSIWIEGPTVEFHCVKKSGSKTINITQGQRLAITYFDWVESENCEESLDSVAYFPFIAGDKKYTFTLTYPPTLRVEADKILAQILSTFKFTN
jgi:hypothetical protein